MDPESPFAKVAVVSDSTPRSMRIIHVNFCDVCHYVWKAPAAPIKCLNCTNEGSARSLVSYETEVFIL